MDTCWTALANPRRVHVILHASAAVATVLSFRLHLPQQRIDRPIHGVPADVLKANHALVVDHINRRPASDAPSAGNGAVRPAAIPEGAPGNLFLDEHAPE